MRTKRIDYPIEAYDQFFDHEWAKTTQARCSGTALEHVVFDLLFTWKSMSNALHTPQLMAKNSCTATNAALEEVVNVFDGMTSRLLASICEKQASGKHSLNYAQRKRVQVEVGAIRAGCVAALESQKLREMEWWNGLIEVRGFSIILWSISRLCFTGLYFGYEDFLTECYRVQTGNQDFEKRKHADFVKVLKEVFEDGLVKKCYTDGYINTCRGVRDALAHNGGRLTAWQRKDSPRKQLEKYNFYIEGGEIQVTASQCAELFRNLRKASDLLIGHLLQDAPV